MYMNFFELFMYTTVHKLVSPMRMPILLSYMLIREFDISYYILFQVREWELQFSEKYDLVGKLMKPGEEPTFYSDASR